MLSSNWILLASTMSSSFGWDLVLGSVKADIRSAGDLVVAFVHWKLLSRGLRVVGTGEHFTALEDKELSELLPDKWNDLAEEDSAYVLRYRRQGQEADKYILKAVRADGDLLVSLVRFADEVVSTWSARPEEAADAEAKRVRDKDSLDKEVEERLIKPMFDEKEKAKEDKKEEEKKDSERSRRQEEIEDGRDPLMIGQPRMPGGFGGAPPFFGGPGDLDPLGGGGGGMIFQPPGMGGGRGRRGQPRFDPFSPLNPDPMGGGRRGRGGGGRGFGDDFPPPGFNDFM